MRMYPKLIAYIAFILTCSNLLSKDLPVKWSKPEPVSILNSTEDDFAPTWNSTDNRLYFNSNSSGKSLLYWSELVSSYDFSKPILMKGLLNNPNENRSYYHFANDGNVYLSAYRQSSKYPQMNLAMSSILRNAWSEPHFIESLQSESFDCQPVVSPDGSILVYSSNRNSGTTADLFMSIRQESGRWSEPIELSELNSDGNEITPFFFSDSLLFFASDGLSGIGGFDVYKAEYFDGLWRSPTPVEDVNTEYDESDFVILPNNFAVFSTNRPGGSGKLDLYVSYPLEKSESIPTIENMVLSFKASPSEIRMNSKMMFLNFSFPNRFGLNDNLLNVNDSIFFKNDCVEFDFVNLNPLDYILNILFKKSESLKSSIRFEISDKSEPQAIEEFVDRVKRLAEYLNYTLDSTDFAYSGEIEKDVFIIQSDDTSSLALSITNNILESSDLQLNIDFETKDNSFKSSSIIIQNKFFSDTIFEEEHSEFPLVNKVNINKFSTLISADDGVNLKAIIKTGRETIKESEVSIPVYSNISKEPYSITINGKKHFVYLLNINSNVSSYESFYKINHKVLGMVKENLRIAKSIKFSSYPDSKSDLMGYLAQFSSSNNKALPIIEQSNEVFVYKLKGISVLLVEIQ